MKDYLAKSYFFRPMSSENKPHEMAHCAVLGMNGYRFSDKERLSWALAEFRNGSFHYMGLNHSEEFSPIGYLVLDTKSDLSASDEAPRMLLISESDGEFRAIDPEVTSAPPAGRGATAAEAIGDWFCNNQSLLGFTLETVGK